MNQKLKIWKSHSTWDAAEKNWDEGAKICAQTHPLKTLSRLPEMPGITEDTARGLKWKSLKYLLAHDHNRVLPRNFFKHPLKYSWNFLRSVFRKKSFTREGDFFFYGCNGITSFETLLNAPNRLLVVGFSYCHKPFECPSGRFSDQCVHDAKNPICRQCFIGKSVHALPETNVIPLFIPTIHYIGEKIFEIVHAHPEKKVLFLITACELTLEMFGDWGNMVGIQGIGVRLDGRVCNTMKAFELSEKGIKPGLTVVLEPTQKKILDLIKNLRKA
ncbi:MAG: hypothetical protein K2P51_06090 [Rhabdochlamydiaceae bacterium]|nr:hypothetical protein [Rhabdochlamydiaceae bacterium]